MPHLISLSPSKEKYFSRSSGQSAAWYQCRRSIKCLWWDHCNNQRWRIWTCKPSCALLKGLAASQYVCYQTCHSGLLTMQHNPSSSYLTLDNCALVSGRSTVWGGGGIISIGYSYTPDRTELWCSVTKIGRPNIKMSWCRFELKKPFLISLIELRNKCVFISDMNFPRQIGIYAFRPYLLGR